MQKITLRNQRAGTSAKHNQHDHIDDPQKEEKALTFFKIESGKFRLQRLKDVNLPRIEYKFYEKYYSKALETSNHKYMKSGHKERIKKISDWLTDDKKRPDEQILQIGSLKQHDPVERAEFEQMILEYVREFNSKWGANMHIIDVAFHYVEDGLPHVHIRSIGDYEKDGIKTISMEKALQALGIERPDLSKKEGRHNNRKMTFTEMQRDLWLNICREHGLEIDTEVKDAGRTHLDTAIFKRQEELEKLDFALNRLIDDIEGQQELNAELDIALEKKFKQIDDLTRDEIVKIAMSQIYKTDARGEFIVKNGRYFLTDWAIEMCDQIQNETFVDITNTSLDHVKEVSENIEILKYLKRYFPTLKGQIIERGRQQEYGVPENEQQINR